MNKIVIGIEGLVGSGKTSICKCLLDYIPNSIILHGGNLYRGIVYVLMQSSKKINIDNLKQNLKNIDIKEVMDKLNVELKIENRESVIYVAGKKIEEDELQSEEASMAVSLASSSANNSHFYRFGAEIINSFKDNFNIIVSGRDLMKIYPELDYHFFITASLEERIKRKMHQYNTLQYEEIKKNIKVRDELQEQTGYYKVYENTIEIDVTNCKSADESAKKVLSFIKV